MITKALEVGKFHPGMSKGLVNLIPKDGDLHDSDFW